MDKANQVSSEKRWHVIYTKSKWEKKVDDLLMQKGFECWCPVQKQERQWSDRKKIIETPLFRSYVFIKACKEDYTQILSTNGVVNFLYFEKKPDKGRTGTPALCSLIPSSITSTTAVTRTAPIVAKKTIFK